MSESVLAVIPARYASSRFPGKPLTPIGGIPMVVRVLDQVRSAKLVDEVLVAVDDERVAEVVREAGGEAVMTDPDLPSGSDRVWAVASERPATVIVNVQGDEPLMPPSTVDAVVERVVHDAMVDISTAVVRVARDEALSPDVVTVAVDDCDRALYFSRSVIPSGAPAVWCHQGIYAYRRRALERFTAHEPTALERAERLEQLRAFACGLAIGVVEVATRTHGVDRPDDVAAVEAILDGEVRGWRGLDEVRLVVLDADGVLTDGRILYLGDEQLAAFDVKDGLGLTRLTAAGIGVAVVSARDSLSLRRRAAELGLSDVRVHVGDKAQALREVAASHDLEPTDVLYIGDDLTDLEAMQTAGWSAAPADAALAVRSRATIQLSRRGGRGAVRELTDRVLAARRPIAERSLDA